MPYQVQVKHGRSKWAGIGNWRSKADALYFAKHARKIQRANKIKGADQRVVWKQPKKKLNDVFGFGKIKW